MPTFQGVVKEDDLVQLIAYIKSMPSVDSGPLNNRTSPGMIRDSEVTNIQQQMRQEKAAPKPSGKQP
jgi:hypothetical protein